MALFAGLFVPRGGRPRQCFPRLRQSRETERIAERPEVRGRREPQIPQRPPSLASGLILLRALLSWVSAFPDAPGGPRLKDGGRGRRHRRIRPRGRSPLQGTDSPPPASPSRGSRSERARGGEQGRTWFLRPHSLDRLPHPPGTSHRLEAPTSSRLTGSLPGQPESHASGEFRKSRRSSGLRPMDCPTLRAGGVRGGGGRAATTSLRFPPALVGAVRGDLLRCWLAT
jgi:hypothetical protein